MSNFHDLSGQCDHGDVGSTPFLPKPSNYFLSIHRRHHEIEDHGVGQDGIQQFECESA